MKLQEIPNKEFHDMVHQWAIDKHDNAGCSYAGAPYSLHLDAVVNVGRQYLGLISTVDKLDVMCALSAHDTIEDCRVNWNELKDLVGPQCADYVYNVTNELGRNRKERAKKTYPKIAKCKYSTFVKLCDRIANMKFSYFMNDERGMFAKYKKEHPDFYKALHNEEHGFEEMWAELQALTLH